MELTKHFFVFATKKGTYVFNLFLFNIKSGTVMLLYFTALLWLSNVLIICREISASDYAM